MQDSQGFHLSMFGWLMVGILQGVVLADTSTVTLYRATGSSLDLILNYSKSVSSVQWHFSEKPFARYSRNIYSFPESQFTGRLKENNDKVGVTVQNLQHQDSGTFKVIVDGPEGQLPSQIFTVYILNPVTAVQINTNQTWRVSTNSCDVDVKCTALGAESVSYLWSGYKTGSEAQLQFSLSPAEGAVTLNCTAANNISSSSATETLSCSAEQHKPEDTSLLLWILWLAGGAAFILLITVVALGCWCRHHKGGSVAENGLTVYADVNTPQKNKRSDSVNNEMTVYETVDDLKINPEMTIYAKVTLPKHEKVSAIPSSPYQQVC